MKTTIEFRQTLCNFRLELIDALKEFLIKHNCKELDLHKCKSLGNEINFRPIIIYGDEDDIAVNYLLDKIVICSSDFICVYSSNAYDQKQYFTIGGVTTDAMIDMYEWLVDNEDKLFND